MSPDPYERRLGWWDGGEEKNRLLVEKLRFPLLNPHFPQLALKRLDPEPICKKIRLLQNVRLDLLGSSWQYISEL